MFVEWKKSFIIKFIYIIYNVNESENKIKTKRLTQHSNVIDEHHSDTSEEDCDVIILKVTRHVRMFLFSISHNTYSFDILLINS